MENKTLEIKLEIGKKKIDELNEKYLSGHGLSYHEGLCKNSTIYESNSSDAENGSHAMLEVFTGEEDILCSIYFYDKDGKDIGHIETDGGISDSYTLNANDGITYNVAVS